MHDDDGNPPYGEHMLDSKSSIRQEFAHIDWRYDYIGQLRAYIGDSASHEARFVNLSIVMAKFIGTLSSAQKVASCEVTVWIGS